MHKIFILNGIRRAQKKARGPLYRLACQFHSQEFQPGTRGVARVIPYPGSKAELFVSISESVYEDRNCGS
jgi:hypothetical protein